MQMLILTALKACKPFCFLNCILSSQLLNEVVDDDIVYPEKKVEIVDQHINQGNCGKQGIH